MPRVTRTIPPADGMTPTSLSVLARVGSLIVGAGRTRVSAVALDLAPRALLAGTVDLAGGGRHVGLCHCAFWSCNEVRPSGEGGGLTPFQAGPSAVIGLQQVQHRAKPAQIGHLYVEIDPIDAACDLCVGRSAGVAVTWA